MTVEIDKMSLELRARAGENDGSAPSGAAAMSAAQLKEILRPIVLEILQEALRLELRVRGR